MSDYETKTVIREPVETVVVRRGSSAGWWVAAIVAIVAIFGVLFMVNNGESREDMPAARDQGAIQADLANAATGAQQAAANAARSAQDASSGAARATESAAQAATERTQQAVDATAAAVRDVSTAEPDPR